MAEPSPTLVLCCTKDIRHLLPSVLEALVGRGLTAEVVSGLEQRDDAPLLAAQRLPNARFVLFSGTETSVLQRARAKLLHAGVHPQRIAMMPIEWRGPADVLAAIETMGIAMAPAPRRSTMVSAEPIDFPPPEQHIDQSTRQPQLSGSVEVLRTRPWVDAMAQHRRVVLASAVGVAAMVALIVVVSSGEEANANASAALGELAPVAAKLATAGGEQVAVAGIVPTRAAEAAAVAASPIAESAIAASPIAESAIGAASPIVAAPSVVAPIPSHVVPPAPAVPPAVPGEEIEIDAEPEIDGAEMQAIYSGLVAQKFRALDILLIAPEPRKKIRKRITKNPARMTWSGASAYCDALDLGGVDDWRLPRVGELGSITRGELIADGKFWSQTEGDTFGKSRVVWNTNTSRMGTAPVNWKGGRVVCVRTMARAPELPPKP